MTGHANRKEVSPLIEQRIRKMLSDRCEGVPDPRRRSSRLPRSLWRDVRRRAKVAVALSNASIRDHPEGWTVALAPCGARKCFNFGALCTKNPHDPGNRSSVDVARGGGT